jgi:hypothetical protein
VLPFFYFYFWPWTVPVLPVSPLVVDGPEAFNGTVAGLLPFCELE